MVRFGVTLSELLSIYIFKAHSAGLTLIPVEDLSLSREEPAALTLQVRDYPLSVFILWIYVTRLVFPSGRYESEYNILEESHGAIAELLVSPRSFRCRIVNSKESLTSRIFLEKWRAEFNAPQPFLKNKKLLLVCVTECNYPRRPQSS